MSFLRTALTGADNQSYDFMRILAVLVVVAFIILSGCDLWHGQPFSPLTWASAVGALFAAISAALRLKAPTEPTQTPAGPP